MKETMSAKRSGFVLIKVLIMAVLALLILVSIASAFQYAYVANNKDSTVSVVDIYAKKNIATWSVSPDPHGVAVSHDGKYAYVYCGEQNGVLDIINTDTGKVSYTLNIGSFPFDVAVSPDDRYIYAACNSGTFYIIQRVSGGFLISSIVDAPIIENGWKQNPRAIALSPDGTKVYLSCYYPEGDFGIPNFYVFDTISKKYTHSFNFGGSAIAVSNDGSKVYVINVGPSITVLDTNKWTFSEVSLSFDPAVLVASLDGSKLYITDTENKIVHVFNTQTFKDITDIHVGHSEGIAISPDGKIACVENFNENTVSLIDTAKNSVTTNVTVGNNPVGFNKFIGVYRIAPIILWFNPADITYGTLLSSTQLNARALDNLLRPLPGTFTYTIADGTPALGALLSAGPHTIECVFTPTDTANYSTVTASVLINVKQFTPTIFWNNPANITVGTPLSSTQLNAAAGYLVKVGNYWVPVLIPGIYTYNPLAGAKLPIGPHTLHVDFTPSDTANYTTSSMDVNINVTSFKIQALSPPVADFSAYPASGKAPLSVEFTDQSQGLPTKWDWDFGDQTKGNKQNPTHIYKKSGLYNVKLSVTNSMGSNNVTKSNYIVVSN